MVTSPTTRTKASTALKTEDEEEEEKPIDPNFNIISIIIHKSFLSIYVREHQTRMAQQGNAIQNVSFFFPHLPLILRFFIQSFL